MSRCLHNNACAQIALLIIPEITFIYPKEKGRTIAYLNNYRMN
uniref:Uncharacterized protein n=1 Tax=Arundo donax TaxID=35708 RepID=A0A0A8Z8B7_ARUDO